MVNDNFQKSFQWSMLIEMCCHCTLLSTPDLISLGERERLWMREEITIGKMNKVYIHWFVGGETKRTKEWPRDWNNAKLIDLLIWMNIWIWSVNTSFYLSTSKDEGEIDNKCVSIVGSNRRSSWISKENDANQKRNECWEEESHSRKYWWGRERERERGKEWEEVNDCRCISQCSSREEEDTQWDHSTGKGEDDDILVFSSMHKVNALVL